MANGFSAPSNGQWSALTAGSWGMQFYCDGGNPEVSGQYTPYVDANGVAHISVRAGERAVNCWALSTKRYVAIYANEAKYGFDKGELVGQFVFGGDNWDTDGVGSAGGFPDEKWSSYQEWSFHTGTRAAGSLSIHVTAWVDPGTSFSGGVDLGYHTIAWDSGYDVPPAPSMSGVTRVNASTAQYSFSSGASSNAPIDQLYVGAYDLCSDSTNASVAYNNRVNYQLSTSATTWRHQTTSTLASSVYIGARNVATGLFKDSSRALFMPAPRQPTSFSGERSGQFGARLTWVNAQQALGMTGYRTRIYRGGTVSVTNGALSVSGGATMLAELAHGVTSYVDANAWTSTEGQSSKTFWLVQCSSYAEWQNPNKASLCSSGKRVDGVWCQPVRTTVTNGASAPDAPTNVVATRNSDTSVTVTWESPGSTASKPITGFRVSVSNMSTQEVTTYVGTDPTQRSATITLDSSLQNSTGTAWVVAYGAGGESPQSMSSTVYGTLSAPQRVSESRGWSSESGRYQAVITVRDLVAWVIRPDHHLLFEWGYGGGYEHSREVSTPGVTQASIVIYGDEYEHGEMSVRVTTVAEEQGAPSSTPLTFTISNACAGVDDAELSQRMDGQVGYCVAVWDTVKDADEYVMTVADAGTVTVEATGDPRETGEVAFMGAGMVTIVAYANGWPSKPWSSDWTFVSSRLLPPTLMSVTQGDGDSFAVRFTNASGGVPIEVGQAPGYRYRVYLDDEPASPQIPSDSAAQENIEGTHEFGISLRDPYDVPVTVTAIDDEGDESPRSNAIMARYVKYGSGAYLYGCDARLEGVRFERCATCLSVDGSDVLVESSYMVDGTPYDVSGDGCAVMEHNVRIGE